MKRCQSKTSNLTRIWLVFAANQRGWVNDDNARDFIAAAELFKASRGVQPNVGLINHGPAKKLAGYLPPSLTNPMFAFTSPASGSKSMAATRTPTARKFCARFPCATSTA